jgi:hypothetical protein
VDCTLARYDVNAARSFGRLRAALSLVVLYVSLELGWNNNQPDISSIPAGVYQCSPRWSKEHGHAVIGINGVVHRLSIEIHPANWTKNPETGKWELLGCVAFGMSRGVLDGQEAILSSALAVDDFYARQNFAEYKTLTTEADTLAWIAANPGAGCFELTITDPVPMAA